MSAAPNTILLLAGSRGTGDKLARQAGVAHKALIPLGGMTMIERVVNVLLGIDGVPQIIIASNQPDALAALPGLTAAHDRLQFIGTSETPSRTVLDALQRGVLAPPLLVTTADHPLLTVDMVHDFWRRVPDDADAAAAVASARTIRAAWPETRRTYLPFADDAYSGCNLFAIRTAQAQRALEFWRRVEERRKQPLAMIRLLGVAATLRFLLGRLSLAAAADHLGRLTQTRLTVITLPFAEAAIDVDKADDLTLVRQILESR